MKKRPKKTWVLLVLCIGICFCLVFKSVCKKTDNQEEAIHNSSTEVQEGEINSLGTLKTGWNFDSEVTLSETDFNNFSVENIIPVQEIIEGTGKWKETNELLRQLTDDLLITPTSKFYGEEGYYISTVPILYYDISEKELSKQVSVLLFSKDFNKAAEMVLMSIEGEVVMNLHYDWNSQIHKLMKESPQMELIFMFNKNASLALDETNTVIYQYPAAEYEIMGDCYQAMYQDSLAVSYNELVTEENLMWIQVEEK